MRVLAALLLGFSSLSASATSGWAGLGKILEIYPSSDQGVLVKHTTNANPSGCSYASYYLLLPTDPFFRETYALLLSAQARGVDVNINLNGCFDNGVNTKPIIALVIGY